MKYLTAGLAPAKVLEIFEQICAIPHGSGNLDAITDFCEKFARDRHLEVIRDEAHNLIIKKPATAGYENAAPVGFTNARLKLSKVYRTLLFFANDSNKWLHILSARTAFQRSAG